jgi:mono/diheme cytochrome c family protein
MKMSFAIIFGGGILVFLAVVMAVVFIPGLVWNPPQTIAAHEYTAQETRGRELYWSNGCDYCHTQYVRYNDNNATGNISQGGNYVFDAPLTLGSERTGPDLSYIGRKRGEAWEIEHLKDPRKLSPMSIMPSFDFLPKEDLQALGTYLYNLGDQNVAAWMIQPPVDYATVVDPQKYPLVQQPSGTDPAGWALFKESGIFDGKETYVGSCQTCHGCAGNGLGTYAGTKVVTPANFKVEPFNKMSDEEWFWHVSEGVPGTVMPPWRESLSDTQRWNVIHYIQQIFSNPLERNPDEGDPPGEYANANNPLPPTVETLENGKHVFTRECMVCHGDAGTGEGVYRESIQPIPPDFSVKDSYKDYTDADYFWRISEGVPWTPMPVWKSRYSEADRWALVYYIRVNFTQTLPRPSTQMAQVYPGIYLTQNIPVDISPNDSVEGNNGQLNYAAPKVEAGKSIYTGTCAHCHGFSGLGDGWDGAYLDVKPANFTKPDVQGLSDGEWLSRVSYGLQNSAMPAWGEWMPLQNRWNVIAYAQKYITDSATGGKGEVILSVFNDGAVAANYAQTSTDLWENEIQKLDLKNGADQYMKFCTGCHGVDGKGVPLDSSGAFPYGLSSPAAFPDKMPFNYLFWRISDGVPETRMGPFSTLLKEADIYDLSAYLQGPVKVPTDVGGTTGPTPTPTAAPGG